MSFSPKIKSAFYKSAFDFKDDIKDEKYTLEDFSHEASIGSFCFLAHGASYVIPDAKLTKSGGHRPQFHAKTA